MVGRSGEVRGDRCEQERVGAVDDVVERRGPGKHRSGLSQEFLAARHMRQVELPQYLARSVTGADEPILQGIELAAMQGGADSGRNPLRIEMGGELRGRTLNYPRSKPLLILTDGIRRRFQMPNEPGPGQQLED